MVPSIIVVNYSGLGFISKAMNSIRYSQPLGSYHIVVVDNGSHDGSVEYLKNDIWKLFNEEPKELDLHSTVLTWDTKKHSEEDYEQLVPCTMEKTVNIITALQSETLTVVLLDKNYRYETGVNVGTQLAEKWHPGTDYILMGSDVEFFRGTIENLQSAAAMHPQIGIVCAKLLGKVGDSRYFVNAGGFTSIMGKEHVTGFDDQPGEWHAYKEQEWVTFSCVYIKNQVFKDVGLMEMQFYIYCGDTDYCRRARQKGWACVFTPDAKAIHWDGKTVALVKRETSKADWDEQQRQEMGFMHHKWLGETVPYPILPAGLFDEINKGRNIG